MTGMTGMTGMTAGWRRVVAAVGLVGCGGAGASTDPDAGRADAAIDGRPGLVTVTVVGDFADFPTEPGAPLVGATVVFVDPGGAETAVATDASGRASAVVAPGAAVFVLRTREVGVGDHLGMFVGLEPGMDVTAGRPPLSPVAPPPLGSVRIVAPAVPGADFYTVGLACGVGQAAPAPDFVVAVQPCPATARSMILVSAFAGDGVLVSYGLARDVDLRAAIGTTIDVPASQAPAIASAVYTSTPPEVVSVAVRQTARAGDVRSDSYAPAVAPGGAVVTVGLPIAPIGDRTEVRTILATPGALGLVGWVRRYHGQRLATRVDLGATMLPFMTTPSVSLGARTAAWTLTGGSGRRPDLIVIRGHYLGPDDRAVELSIIGPGDRLHLTWPRFPAALAAVTPPANAWAQVNEYYGLDAVGRGYRDLIATADREARQLFNRDDGFAGFDDVWITGRAFE